MRGVACDVADAADVERAAQAAFKAFGCVHVVCNNAGVAGGSGIDDISVDTSAAARAMGTLSRCSPPMAAPT